MTKITLQKNVLIDRGNSLISTSSTYKNLESNLKDDSFISVACISEYMNRRIKKLELIGFRTTQIITPISNNLDFCEYIMER